jgi:hypothetical protein
MAGSRLIPSNEEKKHLPGSITSANVQSNPSSLEAAWTIITIVIEQFGWVLVKHPWRMTDKKMYVDYQSWIMLIYLSIFMR